jgi:UDPglucose--hexose-1-phosphate uridylyltransferase
MTCVLNHTSPIQSVPEEPLKELSNLVKYSEKHSGGCLLCDYAKQEVETKKGERVVVLDEESGWVALVPFWAVWPFEIMGETDHRLIHASRMTEDD